MTFAPMPITTANDIDNGHEWLINDEITQFRAWATEKTYPLPSGRGAYVIGAAEGSWLQLCDPTGRVSRQHALLTRSEGSWTIRDLDSTNGLRVDGAARVGCILTPGLEITVGGLTLIAESPKWCVLRAVVQRLIGWSVERCAEVDTAMRRVRTTATRRAALLLCGEGDLVPLAHLLHHHTLGERPFVVCDPKRRVADSDARSVSYRSDVPQAMADAAGGTLCVRHKDLPAEFVGALTTALQPESRVQLIVCARTLIGSEPLVSSAVVIPPLRQRARELSLIVDAYAADAISELGGELPRVDREWILKHEASTLPAIELSTRRLVALRNAEGVVSHAARQLGKKNHTGLREWVQRRRPLPLFQSARKGRA